MKRDVRLSASRISTLKKCSWTYWVKYVLKLPDTTNAGASRGWICHLIFEILGNPRHKKVYDRLLVSKDIFSVESIKRLVMHHAKKMNVDDDENLQLISDMTMAGLNFDFFGDTFNKPDLSISEKEFLLDVNEEGKRYKVLGFIDKLFLYKSASKALIRDFKSSKSVFKGKDLEDNLQDLIYCLAIKRTFPEYKNRVMEFLFLKFNLESKGKVLMPTITDDELDGFEYELTQIQSYLESFSEQDAMSNFAADQGFPKDGSFGGLLACGKDGFKMSRGSPVLDENGNPIKAYICPFRKGFNYYVLINSENKILKSAFEADKNNLIAGEGETIELREYAGCPKWSNSIL